MIWKPQLTERTLRFIFMVVASVSIVLAAYATLAVATIMPVIVADLKGQWLYTVAFGIPLAGQLISTALAGPWCDLRGTQVPILLGLILFIAGLACSAAAGNIYIFILGRAVMGFGGGALMVAMYVLVGKLVPPRIQPKYFAVFAAAWALPAIIGPWVAGVITQASGSWRPVFYSVIPFVIIVGFIFGPVLPLIPFTRGVVDARAMRLAISATLAGLGVAGFLVFSATPGVLSTMAMVVCLIVIVGSVPKMFPHGTFRLRRGLPAIMASRGAVNAAFIATEAFLPLMLQHGKAWTPAHSGLVITAGSVTYAIGSLVQGRISNTSKRARLPFIGSVALCVGVIISGAGAFAIVSGWVSVVGWVIGGLGLGLSYPTLATMALNATEQERHGLVSATLQLADALGGAFALAAITGVFTAVVALPAPGPYLPGPVIALVLSIIAIAASRRLNSDE